jgi:hypothetical protein
VTAEPAVIAPSGEQIEIMAGDKKPWSSNASMLALPERARRQRRGLELDQHEHGGLVTNHAREMVFRPTASPAFWSPPNE